MIGEMLLAFTPSPIPSSQDSFDWNNFSKMCQRQVQRTCENSSTTQIL